MPVLVTTHETIDLPGLQLLAGVQYVCEGQALATFAQLCDGNITAKPISVARRLHETPRSILIMRAGGAGDILFLTPVLKALRDKFPNAHITLATRTIYQWIVANQKGLIDGYSDSPVNWGLTQNHDWVIDLENTVENIFDKHVVDIFLEKCHVTSEKKSCTYVPYHNIDSFAEIPYLEGHKRIALQWAASTPVRTYPHNTALLTALLKRNYQVCVLGEHGTFRFTGTMKNLVNLTELRWPWNRSVDFLQTCDCVIGPDSSMIHFAGAMNIPAIGLYGSFDAKYRTAYHPTIKVLQATPGVGCNISPCFHHGRRGLIFPIDGPCRQHRSCSSLSSITPDEILTELESI